MRKYQLANFDHFKMWWIIVSVSNIVFQTKLSINILWKKKIPIAENV